MSDDTTILLTRSAGITGGLTRLRQIRAILGGFSHTVGVCRIPGAMIRWKYQSGGIV